MEQTQEQQTSLLHLQRAIGCTSHQKCTKGVATASQLPTSLMARSSHTVLALVAALLCGCANALPCASPPWLRQHRADTQSAPCSPMAQSDSAMNLRAPSFKAGLAFVTSKGSCNVGVSVQPTIISVFANYCKFQTEYRLYM